MISNTPEGESFFSNDFSLNVWDENYRNNGESIEGTFRRSSDKIFESESTELKNLLFDSLINKRIFFGGRITANIGTDYKNVSFFNCYSIQRTKKPYDSISGIYADLEKTAQTLKTEGGVGMELSHLRPRGTLIKGVRVPTPGVVKFMKLFDVSSEIITEAGSGEDIKQYDGKGFKKKARKGAQLSLLRIEHPDIIDYVEAKRIPNTLTKFNMSVGITNKFMNCVLDDGDWELKFPNIHFDKYDDEWDGDFDKWESKGYPFVVYRTMKAVELWNIILKNMYNRNEPGMIFLDNANSNNNLLCIGQKVVCVNPCGEILMISDTYEIEHNYEKYVLSGDICNLGGLILTSYYNPTKEDEFDFDLFKADAKLLVRALDNIIDLSSYVFPEMENAAKFRRKVGCGFLGYGSLLFMKKMRYSSPDANLFTTKLASMYANILYTESALLAKEKGSFPLYIPEMISNGFLSKDILTDETKSTIGQYGLRNSSLITCAPTGNNGVFTGIQSGGVEPVYEKNFIRWVNINHKYKEMLGERSYPDIRTGEWFETDSFKFELKGDEEVLMSTDKLFYITKIGDYKMMIECEDFGWTWVKENHTKEEISKLSDMGVFGTSSDLSVDEHIDPFIIWSAHIDNSISKTANISSDYPFEEFSGLFIKGWKAGIRGFTTYRAGTMIAVLESKKEYEKTVKEIKQEQKEFIDKWKGHEGDKVFEEVELPDEYPSRGFVLKSENKKFYLHVAFKDKEKSKPFALFVHTNNRESDILTYSTLDMLESLAKSEGIPQQHIDKNKVKCSGQNNISKLARTISLLLRHNVNITYIVKALDNIDEIPISSFIYRIKKFLGNYIYEIEENGKCCPECGEKVRYTEGCISCTSCAWTKC